MDMFPPPRQSFNSGEPVPAPGQPGTQSQLNPEESQQIHDIDLSKCTTEIEGLRVGVSGVTKEELLQNCALLFAPALDGCRSYSIKSGPQGLPEELRSIAAEPLNRNTAWGAMIVAGIPKDLTKAQGHAFMMALLPYVGQDGPVAQAGICIAASEAAKERDYELYRALGEGCSAAPMHPFLLTYLTAPFCKLQTHNVRNDRALTMWSDVFSEQADRQSLEVIAHAMQERISSGELSTYDHLLTTLCHARDRSGLQLLSNLVERPEQIPAETLAPQAPLHTRKPKLTVKNVAIAFGISCGAILVDTIVSPLAGLGTAAAGGALWALYSARREEKERAKDGSQIIEHFAKAQEAFFSSNPHAHFAERLYHKLSERAPFSAAARALKQRMDDTPRYAHLRDAT